MFLGVSVRAAFCTLVFLALSPLALANLESSDIAALRAKTLKTYKDDTIIRSGECTLKISVTPAGQQAQWGPSESLPLREVVRPEVRNGLVHNAYEFRVCSSTTTSSPKVIICKKATIDCNFARQPVPTASCLVNHLFADSVNFTMAQPNAQPASAKNCAAEIAVARIPADTQVGELTNPQYYPNEQYVPQYEFRGGYDFEPAPSER